MNTAKLRRSQDVSEVHRGKFENIFQISNLAMLNMAFCVGDNGEELAHQAADLIAKSPICGRPPSMQAWHISSGRYSAACPNRGVPTR
jgi:hypothetical protein